MIDLLSIFSKPAHHEADEADLGKQIEEAIYAIVPMLARGQIDNWTMAMGREQYSIRRESRQ